MTQTPTISLDDRLREACAEWCQANDAIPGRLGRLAINDGGFFKRLDENPSASPTTATLGKFARFLADPTNWPDGEVGDEAKAFAHVVGVTPGAEALSASKCGDLTPSVREDRAA